MIGNIVEITHNIIKQKVQPADQVLDGTAGNGNDTLALAQAVGKEGLVYAFDIQDQAIQNTQKRLEDQQADGQVRLFQASHAELDQYLPEDTQLSLAIFNLGYLPRGDKSLITKPNSTLTAIQKLLPFMGAGGLVLIASYIGHPGGMEEFQALREALSQLDQKVFSVGLFQFENQKHTPPRLFIIERKSK